MERKEEVKKKLGEHTVRILIDEIKAGKIGKHHVKKIALQMHDKGQVHGVFEHKKQSENLDDLMRYMLDEWYNIELFKSEINGFLKLINILEDPDIGLDSLAHRIIVDQCVGLPHTYHAIPDLPVQSVDSIQSLSNNHGCNNKCRNHSVGKAIFEILDEFGCNVDQEKIMDTLIQEVKQDNHPANLNEFHNKIINVQIEKKDLTKQKRMVAIELKVQQVSCEINSNYTLNTSPKTEYSDMKNMKMILQWDIGMTLNEEQIFGFHSIYANAYDQKTEMYSCINNWADFDVNPEIHNSRIFAINYFSIIIVP